MVPTLWQVALRFVRSPSAAETAKILHTLSIAAHLCSSVLVFLILCMLLGSELPAWLGAAFFALHPLQLEAVAMVSAFGLVVGGTFALAAIWQYLCYVKGLQGARRRNKHPVRPYYLATAAFILAMLSSPLMVVTPLLASLLARLLPKEGAYYSTKTPSWPLALWVVLAVPQAVWTILSQHTEALTQSLPLWLKPLVAGDAVGFYLAKILLPIKIGPDYGRSPLVLTGHWWGYVSWLVPLLLLLLLSAARKKTFGWYRSAMLVLIAALLPCLGLVYFEAQSTSTVAGRYAYLALLAPAMAVAYAAANARKSWVPFVLVALTAAAGWWTQRNLRYWQTDTALWEHALAVNPASPIAHTTLGNAAMREGNWQLAREHYQLALNADGFSPSIYFNLGEIEQLHGDPHQAIAYYNKALSLNPKLVQVYSRLGHVYLALGDSDNALKNFQAAVEQAPPSEETLRLLGKLYVHRKDYAAAIPYLSQAIQLAAATPGSPQLAAEAHALLGSALTFSHQPLPAKEHLETALRLAPDNPEANRQLADIYFSQGQYTEARPRYERVIEQGHPDFAVYNNMGKIAFTRNEHSKAITYYNAALALQPNDAEAQKNAGISYFRLHQYKEAIASLKKALEIDPSLPEPHFYMGDVARWQGRDADALHEYQLALKSDPQFTEAYYRLGNYYLKKDQLSLAIQQYQAGLKIAPEDAKLLYGLKRAERARTETTRDPAHEERDKVQF